MLEAASADLVSPVGEAPAAALVGPHPIGEHARERLLGIDLGDALGLGIEHPLLAPLAVHRRKAKRGLNASAEVLLGQTSRASLANGGEDGGA